MKKLIGFFRFWYGTTLNYVTFYLARKKADRMHKLTGRRYHVIPSGKHTLAVVDNSFVNEYNRRVSKMKGGKKIDIIALLNMSYYSTGVQGITRK